MREAEYSEAAVEVLDILNYTDKEDVKRIPQSFIKFLTNIASKRYKPQFNHEQPISELNLKKKTKEILGFIYITWWCNDEECEKYKKQIHNKDINKEVKKENYTVNAIFENQKENKEHTIIQKESAKEISVTKYEKENILKKFLNKILKFFRK